MPLVPFVLPFPSWPFVPAGPCDPVAPATVSARRASRLADRAVRSALFAVFRGVAAATALCWAAAAETPCNTISLQFGCIWLWHVDATGTDPPGLSRG